MSLETKEMIQSLFRLKFKLCARQIYLLKNENIFDLIVYFDFSNMVILALTIKQLHLALFRFIIYP